MKTLKNVEEFTCVVCLKKALRATKSRPGRRTKTKICKIGAKTCSRICAVKYRNNFNSIKRKEYLRKINVPQYTLMYYF